MYKILKQYIRIYYRKVRTQLTFYDITRRFPSTDAPQPRLPLSKI